MSTDTKPAPATQLVDLRTKISSVRSLLDANRGQIAMALPKHVTVDRMLRVAMTAIQRTPKLLECSRESLFGAIIQAAQLGLEPDGITGRAYLIPRWNSKARCYEAQFMPGYKGLLELARRSREISTMEARVVHANDRFAYQFGLNQKLEHTPVQSGDDGDVTHVYVIARLKDGGAQFDVLTKAEIEAVRKSSQSGDSGPWATHWDEMAKKTVLRRVCKLLPSSVELAQAVALDEAVEAGIPQAFDLPPVVTVEAGDNATIDAEISAKE